MAWQASAQRCRRAARVVAWRWLKAEHSARFGQALQIFPLHGDKTSYNGCIFLVELQTFQCWYRCMNFVYECSMVHMCSCPLPFFLLWHYLWSMYFFSLKIYISWLTNRTPFFFAKPINDKRVSYLPDILKNILADQFTFLLPNAEIISLVEMF